MTAAKIDMKTEMLMLAFLAIVTLQTLVRYLSRLMAARVADEQLVTNVIPGHSILHIAAPNGQWGSVIFRTTSNGIHNSDTVRSDTAKFTRR